MEAHGAVTIEQNNKKRKIAEDPQTSLTGTIGSITNNTFWSIFIARTLRSVTL
jgi:hypothetical protein